MAPHTCRKEETLETLSKSLNKLWSFASRNRVLVISPLAGVVIFLVLVTWSLTANASTRSALEKKCLDDAKKETDVEVIKKDIEYIKRDFSGMHETQKTILKELRALKK